jgi:hypothetical protein
VTSGADHKFCGDSILGLMAEVTRLRACVASLSFVRPEDVPLDDSVRHLFETGEPRTWRVPALGSPSTGLYVTDRQSRNARPSDG